MAALTTVTGSGLLPASACPGSAGPAVRSWTVYHGSLAGRGVASGVRRVRTTARAWTSPELDGQIYGEPLALGQKVFVATENDTVYALSAATGAVDWSVHLGTPVPAGSLPCGDISPTVGITGTPVIDSSRHEIFVVADEMSRGHPEHVLVGLGTTSGTRELTERADPPGQIPANILQRTALTLDAGHVVFGFGGNYGDCATYRGRVIAVPERGGTMRTFTVDARPGETQGAVWMGGAAPMVDHAGHIWVTTGNGSVYSSHHAYDHSDGLLELSSSLRLLQFFAPKSWASDNAHDLDMSTEPALLPDGQMIAAGKAGRIFLLKASHLGGIGGQQAMLKAACASDIDGGAARIGMTVYLPCFNGIVAVRAVRSPPALRVLWRSPHGGGPPVAAAGLIWTISSDGTLFGLDPATGKVRRQASIGAQANHFPTPGFGAGLMVAPCARKVVAFTTSSAARQSGASSAPAAGRSSACDYSAPGAPLSRKKIAAIIAGGLAAIAGLSWFLWHRRTGRLR